MNNSSPTIPTIKRKIVVVGYREVAPAEMEPDFYVAEFDLTKAEYDQNDLYMRAQRQAREKGGLTGTDMVCFYEEDFSKIRAFNEQFKTFDRKHETYHDEIEKPGIFHGTWEMSVDAVNPRDAAKKIRRFLEDPGESVVFTIQPDNRELSPIIVDLAVGLDDEQDEDDSEHHRFN